MLPRYFLRALVVCATLISSSPAVAQFTQQGPKLVGSPALSSGAQGGAVASSADGNTAIVGGPTFDGTGAAWFWTRDNTGVWTLRSPALGAFAGGISQHGAAVAISADGTTAAVGDPLDNSNAGAVS